TRTTRSPNAYHAPSVTRRFWRAGAAGKTFSQLCGRVSAGRSAADVGAVTAGDVLRRRRPRGRLAAVLGQRQVGGVNPYHAREGPGPARGRIPSVPGRGQSAPES